MTFTYRHRRGLADYRVLLVGAPTAEALLAGLEAGEGSACTPGETLVRAALVLKPEETWPSSAQLAALAKALEAARALPGVLQADSRQGVACLVGQPAGKVALLFPGQGSQYCAAMDAWAAAFPSFREHRDNLLGGELHGILCPAETSPEAEALLRRTEHAQPVLGALALAALGVLRELGVQADSVAGHSYGELPALCAAGRLSERECIALSAARGAAMAQAGGAQAGGATGAMTALLASREAAEQLLPEVPGLAVANHNAPSQTVLSGTVAEIEQAEALLSSRKLRFRRLPVSSAFHSRLMAGAAQDFAQALPAFGPGSPRLLLYLNHGNGPFLGEPSELGAYLTAQLTSPVEFVKMIQRMYDDGHRLFVEVGPGSVLSGLTEAILKGSEAVPLPVDGPVGRQNDLSALALALGAAWVYQAVAGE